MIGGKVHTFALLAAVIVCAVCRVEDTVQYTPWCSRKVSAQLTVLIPRPAPSKRCQKYNSKRLYIVLLLLLLAGDVELNPGPSALTLTSLNPGPTDMKMKDETSPKLADEPISSIENFVLNRTKALKKKDGGLNRSDYSVSTRDGMQVTIKLNSALFELFKNEYGSFSENEEVLVTDKKTSQDRSKLITKVFMKLVYKRLKVAMTCYYTTSTILIQSNEKGQDGTGAAMIFTEHYLVPFLDHLVASFPMTNIQSDMKEKISRALSEEESKAMFCSVCLLPLTYRRLRGKKTVGVRSCASSSCQKMAHTSCVGEQSDIWLCVHHRELAGTGASVSVFGRQENPSSPPEGKASAINPQSERQTTAPQSGVPGSASGQPGGQLSSASSVTTGLASRHQEKSTTIPPSVAPGLASGAKGAGDHPTLRGPRAGFKTAGGADSYRTARGTAVTPSG